MSANAPHPDVSSRYNGLRLAAFVAIPVAIIVYAMTHAGWQPRAMPVHLHWPRWRLLAAAGPIIEIHAAAAVFAVVLGGVVLGRVKGTTWHKRLGWVWVIAMAVVAISSIFIRVLNPGHFSLIHTLTGLTIISLPLGILAVRRHDVARHRRIMTRLFLGGMVVAGLFTFMPGRLMFRVFLG